MQGTCPSHVQLTRLCLIGRTQDRFKTVPSIQNGWRTPKTNNWEQAVFTIGYSPGCNSLSTAIVICVQHQWTWTSFLSAMRPAQKIKLPVKQGYPLWKPLVTTRRTNSQVTGKLLPCSFIFFVPDDLIFIVLFVFNQLSTLGCISKNQLKRITFS